MISILFAYASLAAVFEGVSAEELNRIGISKLSDGEKTALESWINRHYSKKIAAHNSSKKLPFLQENLKGGHYIRLSDDSLWEIDPADTPISQGWITPVDIKVTAVNDPDFPFTLTNTLTSSTVKARKAIAVPSLSKINSPVDTK